MRQDFRCSHDWIAPVESARAAIVTGASSGIGLAVARMLGEDGHAVTLVARRPDKLEAAYEQLRGEGLEVQRVAANVGSEDDVIRAVAAHRDAYGRLDVLMNNAGMGVGAPIGELSTKQMDLQIAGKSFVVVGGTAGMGLAAATAVATATATTSPT